MLKQHKKNKVNFKTDLPCVICGKITENGNTFHHLYTRKAHPKLVYEKENMIPTCKNCHAKIFHSLPLSEIAENWEAVKSWLIDNNWHFDEKWRNFKLLKMEQE